MNPFPTLSLVGLFCGTGEPVPYGFATRYLLFAGPWQLVSGIWHLAPEPWRLVTGDW